MVRNWLTMTVEDQYVVHKRLEIAVGGCLGLFYADNILVVSCYLEWLQGALNVLIGLLCWYVMVVNVAKSMAMIC